MSKVIIFLALIVMTTLAFAKRDVDMYKFNYELNRNIDSVLEHNPQMYEKDKSLTRKPASVGPKKNKNLKINSKGKIKDIEVGHPQF